MVPPFPSLRNLSSYGFGEWQACHNHSHADHNSNLMTIQLFGYWMLVGRERSKQANLGHRVKEFAQSDAQPISSAPTCSSRKDHVSRSIQLHGAGNVSTCGPCNMFPLKRSCAVQLNCQNVITLAMNDQPHCQTRWPKQPGNSGDSQRLTQPFPASKILRVHIASHVMRLEFAT